MKVTLRILCCITALITANLSWGFGATGHRVVGEIASNHLTPKARANIERILDGKPLAFAATWPDEQRSNPHKEFWGYGGAANWHFINVPKNTTYEDSKKEPKGDAKVALEFFIAALKDEPLPDGPVKTELAKYFKFMKYGSLESQKARKNLEQFAVKFIVHIVGDVHQPLHLGYESDAGGNKVSVYWFGQKQNLHSVWDENLVDAPGLSFTELVRLIDIDDESKIKAIQGATIIDWIHESLDKREEAYDFNAYHHDFSYDYTYRFVPVIQSQMLHGGLRAAAVFNSIYK